MYELDVERTFSAAHHLTGYDGKCCGVHGHNWVVQVFVRAFDLDPIGISVDFVKLKRALEEILSRLDHKDLNTVPPFDAMNPTSENLARWICTELASKIDDGRVKVHRVRICEGPTSGATWFAE